MFLFPLRKISFSNYLPIYFIDTMYQLVCLIYVVHIENRLSPFDNTVPEYYWPKVCGCVGVGGGGAYIGTSNLLSPSTLMLQMRSITSYRFQIA